jgi:hypothetical protein
MNKIWNICKVHTTKILDDNMKIVKMDHGHMENNIKLSCHIPNLCCSHIENNVFLSPMFIKTLLCTTNDDD